MPLFATLFNAIDPIYIPQRTSCLVPQVTRPTDSHLAQYSNPQHCMTLHSVPTSPRRPPCHCAQALHGHPCHRRCKPPCNDGSKRHTGRATHLPNVPDKQPQCITVPPNYAAVRYAALCYYGVGSNPAAQAAGFAELLKRVVGCSEVAPALIVNNRQPSAS